jgi:hypothetical protein
MMPRCCWLYLRCAYLCSKCNFYLEASWTYFAISLFLGYKMVVCYLFDLSITVSGIWYELINWYVIDTSFIIETFWQLVTYLRFLPSYLYWSYFAIDKRAQFSTARPPPVWPSFSPQRAYKEMEGLLLIHVTLHLSLLIQYKIK